MAFTEKYLSGSLSFVAFFLKESRAPEPEDELQRRRVDSFRLENLKYLIINPPQQLNVCGQSTVD
jgi:hypothetical protein